MKYCRKYQKVPKLGDEQMLIEKSINWDAQSTYRHKQR
jgi:hypothetical protein